jgi:aldehyde dehydrogenase (NAD+)
MTATTIRKPKHAALTVYQHFIDDAFVDASSGESFPAINPFTGEEWARIAKGTPDDVDAAVQAANRAFSSAAWAGITATERGDILFHFADVLARSIDRLAEVEMTDNGKLLSEVRGQIAYIPKYFRYFAGLADKVGGSVIPIDKKGVLNFTRREPLGVVAAITPWNSSLTLAVWKLAPALAAGNTVVVKPSEHTSASMLELAAIVHEAGVPTGVFNVVTGFGADVGQALVSHPLVARVAFTGGDAGGRGVYRAAAEGLKPVSLELGGKSPHIVFGDADLEQAARGVITGIFSAGGQTCMAGSRLLVEDSIHDRFVGRLIELAKDAKAGDPRDPTCAVGPIATRPQFEHILNLIEVGKAEGARCVLGGKALQGPGYGAGQFVAPTIFVDVKNSMRIAQEEVFGPVLCVLRFSDEAEALAIANDTRFGLAAGVWTRDLARTIRMSEKLKAGTVWINNYRATSFTTPFGGYKDSGLGREGGVESFSEYTQLKSVWITSEPNLSDPFVRKY